MAWAAGDSDDPDEFEVWPENWPIVQAFLALSTQWNRAGMDGARCGLKYEAFPTVYEGLGIKKKKRPEVFRGLQTMEHAALQEMNRAG
jgi:hypothetical protein